MKKITMTLLALAAGAFLRAEDSVQTSSYSVTMDFPYVSKYVFRGLEYGNDAIQPSVELSVGNGYVGIWTSQPIEHNDDNEFDFYAGYKLDLNDQWSLDLGSTVYTYPELDNGPGVNDTTVETYLGINGDISGIKPGAYVYYDWTLESWTGQVQLGYSYPLKDIGVSLDFSGSFGGVIRDDEADYLYWSLGTQANYTLSEKASLYAGIAYTSNDLKRVEGNFWVFTTGLSVGF